MASAYRVWYTNTAGDYPLHGHLECSYLHISTGGVILLKSTSSGITENIMPTIYRCGLTSFSRPFPTNNRTLVHNDRRSFWAL